MTVPSLQSSAASLPHSNPPNENPPRLDISSRLDRDFSNQNVDQLNLG